MELILFRDKSAIEIGPNKSIEWISFADVSEFGRVGYMK